MNAPATPIHTAMIYGNMSTLDSTLVTPDVCYSNTKPLTLDNYIELYLFTIPVLITLVTILVVTFVFCEDEGMVDETVTIMKELEDEDDMEDENDMESQEAEADDEADDEAEEDQEEEQEEDDNSNYETTSESGSEDSHEIYEDVPIGLKRRRKV